MKISEQIRTQLNTNIFMPPMASDCLPQVDITLQFEVSSTRFLEYGDTMREEQDCIHPEM